METDSQRHARAPMRKVATSYGIHSNISTPANHIQHTHGVQDLEPGSSTIPWTLNSEVLRADEGEMWWKWSSTGMQGMGKWEIPNEEEFSELIIEDVHEQVAKCITEERSVVDITYFTAEYDKLSSHCNHCTRAFVGGVLSVGIAHDQAEELFSVIHIDKERKQVLYHVLIGNERKYSTAHHFNSNYRVNIPQLTAAARGAICESGGDVAQLHMNLQNGPFPVFCEHKDCRTTYCVRKDP
ncbi:hypothetical protein PR048_011307 [Dryococelus australis]|uniref:Uncharacterized protein n=1 Tax=Dryococelus australis TaxID=614101 RepID=A0ABQ9HLZ3_9NEOP|nr:hypothetical protein PR048_011307 [Dryococelus australis]